MEKKKKETAATGTMWSTTRITANPYEEIAELKDGIFHFDFPACRRWLEMQGKQIFGERFRIFPEDHEVILTLLVYAIADTESARKKT